MSFHSRGAQCAAVRPCAIARLTRRIAGTFAASALLVLNAGLVQAQTPVTITPPNLAGAVAGSLPGAASVSPSGAATYSIPLPVPPGTAGIAPSVALEYSSQAGMGLLGQGWGIGGLSSITRCGKTVAQDLVSTTVKLVAEDQFCLDGRRLLLVSGTHAASAEYRTDIDNFSRIQSSGSNTANGPDSFKVEAKGGLIYTYGSSADATIEAAGRSVRHTWALFRVEDRRGNYYSISYSENNATGEYFPTQIRYTGNLNSGLAPYNAVRFIYETRPDIWQDYLVGSAIGHTQRLTAIRTYTNTASDGTGGALVRDYRISYRTNATNGRSLVDYISDCDGAGNCLTATQFSWTQRDAASNNFSASGSGVWGGPVAVYTNTAHKNVWNSIASVDVNGDGKTDLIKSLENGTWQVCLSTGSAFDCQNWAGPNKKMNEVGMGDFNGDGRTDLAYNNGTTGFVCFSTGSGFNCQTSSHLVGSTDSIGDFNGDGRDDFAFCYSQGNGSFVCDTVTTPGGMGMLLEEDAICPDEIRLRRNITGDFNGDGKVDYLVINMWSPACPNGNPHAYNWGLYIIVNGGSQVGWVASSAAGLPLVDVNFGRVQPPGSSTGSFNDDGYLDIVMHGLTGGRISLCRGTGDGFACTSPTVDATLYDHTVYHVGDFDGDGRADTVHFTAANQARVCQVGGNGSYVCANWGGGSGPARMYGDFNGDGKTDLAYYSETTQWTIGLADGPVPDLLQAVTNGVGHVTEFSYAGLNNVSVYTRGADVLYPKRNLGTGLTVVSQMRAANALGDWFTTSYAYEGLRTDLQGRGSLGFAIFKTTDHVNSVTTTSGYSQDFPTTGMPATINAVSSGVVLSATTNSLASMTTVAGARHPYVNSSTVATRDLNNAEISTTTSQINAGGIDAYGNVTSSVQTIAAVGETFSTTTVNTYDNLTTPWLIGLLRTSSVTKSATQTGTQTSSPTLAFANCSSTSPTTSPTAATMRCTLANNGQTVASSIAYGAPAGTTVSGPANCSANTTNCGLVTVTSGTAPGSYSGTLTATPTPAGTAASTSVGLTVNATPPALTLTGCSSTTPTTSPTAATMSCTLANTGQTAATSIVYGSSGGTSASGPASCSGNNSNCGTVTVTTSTSAGSYSGTLTATPTPAGSAGSAGYSLTVNPTPPALTLTSCSSTTPTTSPTPATMSCVLGNSGQTAAASVSYSTAGGTSVSGPSSCGAGASNCGSVTVTTGTAAGTYAGTLTATPNTGSAASASVNLTVNAAAPAMSSNPTSLAFGTVAKGMSSAMKTFTVTNSGTAPATGLSYSITYTSGSFQTGSYSWTSSCPAAGGSLAAGSSCTVNIDYDAGCTGGTRNGQFRTAGSNFTAIVTSLTAATSSSGVCN